MQIYAYVDKTVVKFIYLLTSRMTSTSDTALPEQRPVVQCATSAHCKCPNAQDTCGHFGGVPCVTRQQAVTISRKVGLPVSMNTTDNPDMEEVAPVNLQLRGIRGKNDSKGEFGSSSAGGHHPSFYLIAHKRVPFLYRLRC